MSGSIFSLRRAISAMAVGSPSAMRRICSSVIPSSALALSSWSLMGPMASLKACEDLKQEGEHNVSSSSETKVKF